MVYVGTIQYPYGRMVMFHMMADSLEELHQMANNIGVQRKWFQDKPGFPHYDICKSKKVIALKFGASEINDRAMILIAREKYRTKS